MSRLLLNSGFNLMHNLYEAKDFILLKNYEYLHERREEVKIKECLSDFDGTISMIRPLKRMNSRMKTAYFSMSKKRCPKLVTWHLVEFPGGHSFNFTDFAKTSTINGLDTLARQTSISCRIAWLLLMTGVLFLATIMCYNNCVQYLQYDIQTTMEILDKDDSIEFPAITFCTTSMLKASYFGRYSAMADYYADAVATWDGNLQQSCKSDAAGPYIDPTDLQNFYALLNKITLTYKDVVMTCWFEGRPVQCAKEKYFSLSVSDMGSCFTFSKSGQKLRTGINNGLRLLMNIHQEEYCTPFNAYDGIGLLFGYKDFNAPFLFNYEKGFRYLPAGYEVQINIKRTIFIRHTEHLGRCTSRLLYDSNGHNPLPYFSGFCFTRNLIKLIYDKCHCMAPVPDSFKNYLNERNFQFNFNKTSVGSCFTLKYALCLATVLQRYWHNNAWNNMPKCPMPCNEK
uniref:Uncharacterized protein n=1 Tax=Romanomermis culicivorax TaxID=13658 RepID=A0A915KGC6_ROMCU